MKKEMIAALAIAGLGLTACGGSSGNKEVDRALGQQNANTQGALAGTTYKSDCQNRLLDVVKVGSAQVAYKFDSNKEAVRTTTYFADNGCQKASFEVTEKGTWSGLDKTDNDNSKIDIHWTTATVKPLPEADGIILKGMNVANVCGVNTWAVNEQKDVSKDSGSCPFVEKVPADQFDILHVNTDKGELTLGKGEQKDKVKAESRPTEIDKSVVYKK